MHCPECGGWCEETDDGLRCEDCGVLYSSDSTEEDYEELDDDDEEASDY